MDWRVKSLPVIPLPESEQDLVTRVARQLYGIEQTVKAFKTGKPWLVSAKYDTASEAIQLRLKAQACQVIIQEFPIEYNNVAPEPLRYIELSGFSLSDDL